MQQHRNNRVDAGDVEQDEDQAADEGLGHVGEGGVADEDAQHEGRQQVDELAERRRNRQAAELIARQRGDVAEKEEDETCRAHDLNRHPAVGEIDEERRAAHAGRDGREAREDARDVRVARALADVQVQSLHRAEREEHDDADEDLEHCARRVVKCPEADGLAAEHAEVEPEDQPEIRRAQREETLEEVGAAGQEQHDRHRELRVVEDHQERRGDNDEAESRDGLQDGREKDDKSRREMSSETCQICGQHNIPPKMQ